MLPSDVFNLLIEGDYQTMIMQPPFNLGTRVYFVNGFERLPYY